jgi:hypothetical protein
VTLIGELMSQVGLVIWVIVYFYMRWVMRDF